MMNENQLTYLLQLADNALILGHRNSEWCGHGPVLEQDIAISNISLDLIGQARNFYQYAATGKGGDTTEDTLAYFRDSADFRNVLLAEQPKGDWAVTVLRQFFFSVYQAVLFPPLSTGRDAQISAIASKSLKEIAYHVRWSSEWVIRLGDGTEESRDRMLQAANTLWKYTDELFIPSDYESALINEKLLPGFSALQEEWLRKVTDVFDEATLPIPASPVPVIGGKQGKHTNHLDEILKELQSVARAQPAATW